MAPPTSFALLPSVGTWLRSRPALSPTQTPVPADQATQATVLIEPIVEDAAVLSPGPMQAAENMDTSFLFLPSVGTWYQPLRRGAQEPAPSEELQVEESLVMAPVDKEIELEEIDVDVAIAEEKEKAFDSPPAIPIDCEESEAPGIVPTSPVTKSPLAAVGSISQEDARAAALSSAALAAEKAEAAAAAAATAAAAARAATGGARFEHHHEPKPPYWDNNNRGPAAPQAPSNLLAPPPSSSRGVGSQVQQEFPSHQPSEVSSIPSRGLPDSPQNQGSPDVSGITLKTGSGSPTSPEKDCEVDSSADGKTPLLGGRLQPGGWKPPRSRPLMKPVDRRRVGPTRRTVRDQWNLQELLLFQEMFSLGLDYGQGLGEEELHGLMTRMSDEQLPDDVVARSMRLATRGRPVCGSMPHLHYALRGHYGRSLMPENARREIALADLGPRGCIEASKIHSLLERLNDGQSVLMAEAEMVLHDACLMVGEGPPGRQEVVPAIAAWYLHIERRKTPWHTLLQLWTSRWTPKKEYHAAIWDHLTSMEASAPSEMPPRADSDAVGPPSLAARIQHWGRAGCILVALVLALIFPTLFFVWIVYAAATEGDDRCPRDLDGLMLWFGMLGLSAVIVDMSHSKNETPSALALLLRVVLLLLPWVGCYWSWHLSPEEILTCRREMTDLSTFLWTTLVLIQFATCCFLGWELSVLAENERTLQQSLGTGDDA
mmetsp:Transcript_81112/g.178165  ORF Transcript_81112/g.178165 Transcript_81112/m.178165 type:complete len:714 (+) Transcript_81112:750-2891(+)